MQIRGWLLWGANGRPPSNCRRPVARRNLRAVLIGADADLGHDEFHQFRPWRIRHARHVCRIPGRGLAAWRPGGIHPCRGLCSACAWHCDLSFAYPSCHSRSDACADSLDLRTCIIASLYGVLHLLREFCVAAANRACRHGEFRRRIFAGGTARRRRHCDRAYGGAAHLADPLDHRQQAVGRRGRSRRRDADGHPAGPHANAGLGAIGRRGRHCRRADGDRLSVVAVGRRDLRPDRFRRRGAWRLRQRTRVALCRADHRIDPGRLRILARRNLQRHRGLRPVRRAAVVPAARIDGEGVNKALGSRLAVVLLAAGLLLYPMVLSGAFYRDIGVTFLLAAISASAWNIVGGYAGQVSVGHSMFFGLGAYTPLMFYTLWGWPPITGIPAGIALAIGLSLIIGTPTFRLTGHYFSMATIAVAELIRIFTGTWDFVGATIGLQGPAIARGWWDLTFRSELPYYYLFLAVLVTLLAVTTFIERRRFGFYLRAIKASERAARSSAPNQNASASALGSVHVGGRFPLCDQDGVHRSRQRRRHPHFGADGHHCRAGWCRNTVRPVSRRAHPDPAAKRHEYVVRRRRLGPDLHPLWRHHRPDCALRTGRLVRPVAARAQQLPETLPCLKPRIFWRRPTCRRASANSAPWPAPI